jgi:plastocyanin
MTRLAALGTLLLLGAAVAPARAGDVAGRIALTPPPKHSPTANLYGKFQPPDEPVLGPGPYAVVAFHPAGERAVSPVDGPETTMDQRESRFLPRILPVQTGTRVRFLNSDPIFHNVFSLSPARKFDLGRYPRGDSRVVRFEIAGVVQVFCDIHAQMVGYVVAVDTPYFTLIDREGEYRVENLPAGTYTAAVWVEGTKQFTALGRVAVPATGEVTFNPAPGETP